MERKPLTANVDLYGIQGEKQLMNFGLGWKYSEWGKEGRKIRNHVARELRKQGYEVKVETVGFWDLARDESYLLEAHWPGSKKSPMGVSTDYQHRSAS